MEGVLQEETCPHVGCLSQALWVMEEREQGLFLPASPQQPGEELSSHSEGHSLPTKPVLLSTILATLLPSLNLEMQLGSFTHLH